MRFETNYYIVLPQSDGKHDITNLSSAVGFYKVNGMLQPGTSGSPVFNESGEVIGVVEGGVVAGSDDNDVVPIAPVAALLQKHGVEAGIGSSVASTLRVMPCVAFRRTGLKAGAYHARGAPTPAGSPGAMIR